MNTDQLTALLARIQVLDNRQIDQLTIEAWEPLVSDLDYDDAVEAVNSHFRTSPKYLTPYHVVNGAALPRMHRESRQSDLARKRVVQLGGAMPTYWNGRPREGADLARIGALIESGDPQGDVEARKIVDAQRQAASDIEAGRQWVKEHQRELGLRSS